MKEQVHSNFIKASNLIFATVGLGIINFFFSRDNLSNGAKILAEIFGLLCICVLGLLVRRGYAWGVKYLFLLSTIFGLILIMLILSNQTQNPIVFIVPIAQTVIQAWAMILLFRVPKITESKLVE
ncbi:MAG TPA: hypothetical protein VFC67_21070 [Prolixibacteraceae bacterium]|nr:hypothetical protein [Prolixibacteraceae bacterium]